jgi:hypothetical protein
VGLFVLSPWINKKSQDPVASTAVRRHCESGKKIKRKNMTGNDIALIVLVLGFMSFFGYIIGSDVRNMKK